jgi:CRISPR-associated protein Cas1
VKHHLNTLFVTTENAYLAKDGQAVLVRVQKETRLRVPFVNLDGIVCFGRVGASPSLLGAAAEAGITISFLNEYGRFRAAVVGFSPGNVLLRREQYRRADDPALTLAITRNIVAAKIANCRSVLLRGKRDTSDAQRQNALEAAAAKMARQLDDARTSRSAERLLGTEGEAAATYFSAFPLLINTGDEAFRFVGRSRRPPLDATNALLSFLYSMLAHDARSACEAAGLDAAVGFLHRDRPGRPGLALDLIEEFRPILADRLALSLINRRQVAPAGFQTTESGAVLMDERTRKTVLTAYQKKKQDAVMHPFLEEKTSLGLFIHLQARLFARHLRGDLDAYPPFIWK